MSRLFMTVCALGALLILAETASAQHRGRGRGCGYGPGLSHSRAYYSYRSYGPGTHISRYAVPSVHARRNHYVPRSIHHRVPPNIHSHRIYHAHPYYPRSYHPYGYGRSGLSFSIGF